MDDSTPSPSKNQTPEATRITDLDEDALAHCARYLSLQDVSNLAMSCKSLKMVAYSDSIWHRFFSDHWPVEVQPCSSSQSALGVRQAYLARRTAVHQFKFADSWVYDFYTDGKPFNHLILNRSNIIFSQGSVIQMLKTDSMTLTDSILSRKYSFVTLHDHKARVTCMRLFSLQETSLFRSETQRKQTVLVTSSCDHSIRLWWKGSCQRCYRGHNGPVSTLSDQLLGDGSVKVLGSGGEDGTVRLWSLSSSGKRGQHALKATLYGHERPVKLMSVAGHRTSLLVSISNDSKVRVWDTTASSASRSSCCVGMTLVPGAPVNMKCHDSLVYVAAGSSVVAIDLRTMQKVITAAIDQPKLQSFDILPSKSLICTGGIDKAMLWDVRRNQESLKPKPVAELDGHTGPVTQVHMDPYKIVTGGPHDLATHVWEAESGCRINSLYSCLSSGANPPGCCAMAVDGCQIVTAGFDDDQGMVRYRDFTNATCPVSTHEYEHVSKFWDSKSYSYSDTDSDSSDTDT